LPVLLMMVSQHYPFLFTHPQSWLVVGLIIIAGALIRHYINRVDAGDDWNAFGWAAPLAAFALICAIWITAPRTPAATSSVSDAEVLAITQRQPVKMVLRAAYQSDRASQWIAERAKINAVTLPFTVGGDDAAKDLFALFDDTIQRLLRGAK